MNISGAYYVSVASNIGSQAAINRQATDKNMPVSFSGKSDESGGISQRVQQGNLESMSGNEFRSMANELFEQGEINAGTHKNMIRSLLFSTELEVTGLGSGVYASGTYIDDQTKKINMLDHFETVLLEKKENIQKYNLAFDIKPYEQIVTTLEQLNEKYNSSRVNLTA